MPKIPIYERRVLPPARSGSVQASPNAFGQTGEVLSGFGKNLSNITQDFAKELKDARETSQFSTAQAKMIGAINQRKLEAEDDTDYLDLPERYQKNLESDYQAIAKEIVDPDALRQFNNAWALKKQETLFNFQKLSRDKEIIKMGNDYLTTTVPSLIDAGDIEGLKVITDAHVEKKIITPEQGARIKKNGEYRIKYNGIYETANIMLEEGTAKKNPEAGYETAKSFINKSELKLKDKKALIKTVEADYKTQKAKAKEEQEKLTEDVEENIADFFIKKDYSGARRYLASRDAVDGLKGSRRQDLIKEVDTALDKASKGEKGPFEKTDPKIYAEALTDVIDNPDQFKTRAEIRQKYHGKGVGNDKIDDIIKKWDQYRTKPEKKKDVTKTDAFKAGFNYLKELNKQGILIDAGIKVSDKEKLESIPVLNQKIDLLEEYLDKNPNASRADAIDYIKKITTIEKEGFISNLLSGLFSRRKQEETPTSQEAEERKPSESELNYFKKNPNVAGMATEDNKVIINPYINLSPKEQKSVIINEQARIYMRTSGKRPDFKLTDNQKKAFRGYGSEQDIKETIAARILSGDSSALDITNEQKRWVDINLKDKNKSYTPEQEKTIQDNMNYYKKSREETKSMKNILQKNKDKNFIQRLFNPDLYPVIKNPDGTYSTHLMSSADVEEKHIAYPLIIYKNGRLEKLSQKEAVKYALETGEFIEFPTQQEANDFAINYKEAFPKNYFLERKTQAKEKTIKYKTDEEVRADYKAGIISKEEAKKILKRDFNYK